MSRLPLAFGTSVAGRPPSLLQRFFRCQTDQRLETTGPLFHQGSGPLADVSGGETSRLLFVVGLMRSGTSLLYRLLNSHPQIALLYESDLFTLRPLLWPSGRPASWRERLDFWNGALTRHGLTGANAHALPQAVHGPDQALLALGRAYARAHGKPGAYIGSKSVHYSDHLPSIATAFPRARFVVLWRPVGEIIDSIQRAGRTDPYFAPARRVRQVFQQYGALARGVLALRRLACPVLEVRYEELVRHSEATCARLCEFLDLSWSPEMLRLKEPAAYAAIPDQPHHFRVRHSPVGTAPIRRSEIQPAMAAKIRRYEHFWAAEFAGQPVRLANGSDLPPKPQGRSFWFDRAMARVGYRVHQALIFAKLLIYRFVPLSWLRRYRASAWHTARRKT